MSLNTSPAAGSELPSRQRVAVVTVENLCLRRGCGVPVTGRKYCSTTCAAAPPPPPAPARSRDLAAAAATHQVSALAARYPGWKVAIVLAREETTIVRHTDDFAMMQVATPLLHVLARAPDAVEAWAAPLRAARANHGQAQAAAQAVAGAYSAMNALASSGEALAAGPDVWSRFQRSYMAGPPAAVGPPSSSPAAAAGGHREQPADAPAGGGILSRFMAATGLSRWFGGSSARASTSRAGGSVPDAAPSGAEPAVRAIAASITRAAVVSTTPDAAARDGSIAAVSTRVDARSDPRDDASHRAGRGAAGGSALDCGSSGAVSTRGSARDDLRAGSAAAPSARGGSSDAPFPMVNMGNTCYQSSVIQLLLSLQPLELALDNLKVSEGAQPVDWGGAEGDGGGGRGAVH